MIQDSPSLYERLGGVYSIATVIDLPFAPRAQLLLPGRDRLLVADAFGGRLTLVEPSSRKVAG